MEIEQFNSSKNFELSFSFNSHILKFSLTCKEFNLKTKLQKLLKCLK